MRRVAHLPQPSVAPHRPPREVRTAACLPAGSRQAEGLALPGGARPLAPPPWPGSPLEGLSHSSLSPHFQAQAWPSTGCQYRYAAGPDSQVDLPGAQGGPRGTTLLPITAWGWQTDTQQPHGTRHAGKRQRGQSLDGGTQLTTPQAKPFEPKTQG